jgi:hypothetical protein
MEDSAAITNAKAFVEGIGAVAAASDDAINAVPTHAQRLNIDVKNIYSDAYAILSGLFGEDGNKDHGVLNQYEGTMNIAPETKPDYGYETEPDYSTETEPDYSTETEPDSNTKKDPDSNLGVIIICAVLAATVGGRVFAIAVLVIGMAGIATHLSADYLRFIPGIIRAEIICVIASLVMCIAEQYAVDLTIPVRAVINASILETVYTVFVSFVFWLLLKKTMFRDKKKQPFTINERD